MIEMYFCLGALVLFTVGFYLVKRGNPYKYGGGDSYTRRRMFRMLGWMMWTTAGVMASLTLLRELNSNPLTDATVAQSSGRPEIASIRTATNSTRIFPNLLHEPTLKADAASGVANGSAAATGSLTLSSIEMHHESIMPSMLTPVPDHATVPAVTMDNVTPVPEAEAPAPGPLNSPLVPSVNGGATMNPAVAKQLDAELAAAEALVKRDPSSVVGYLQRGNVYGNEKRWDLAKADYQHALDIDSTCVIAAFNIAELEFMQGHYDAARPGFLAIVNSADVGDLAKYKVFLCDLFGGREEVAAKELAVFNQVGSEASYYFANVAWSLYHKRNDDAQSWWQSANQIFAPEKVNLYAKPLIALGYIKVTS